MSEAETLANYRVDKSGWPDGPWMQEPDRVQWRTESGLPGLVVRQGSHGGWCGYVAVPPGHPLHGVGYSQCPQDCSESCQSWCEHDPQSRLTAHGGLTYSDRCMADGPICHVPEPGEPDDVWWFGFDCSHGGDYSPGYDKLYASVGFVRSRYLGGETYKDLAYVTANVESLAQQLAQWDGSGER